MSITGKYDFKGIKKYGAQGIQLALSTTAWGAVLIKIPVVGTMINLALELVVNWLANKGLMVLNIAAIAVEGKFDQMSFDSAMDKALSQVEMTGRILTPAQKKAIDDEVIKSFRNFAVFTKHN